MFPHLLLIALLTHVKDGLGSYPSHQPKGSQTHKGYKDDRACTIQLKIALRTS